MTTCVDGGWCASSFALRRRVHVRHFQFFRVARGRVRALRAVFELVVVRGVVVQAVEVPPHGGALPAATPMLVDLEVPHRLHELGRELDLTLLNLMKLTL